MVCVAKISTNLTCYLLGFGAPWECEFWFVLYNELLIKLSYEAPISFRCIG